MKNNLLLVGSTILAITSSSYAATMAIGAGTYTENFNTLSTGQQPAPGWDIRTGATVSSLGLNESLSSFLRAWDHDSGQFKNVSSNDISQSSDLATQFANPNRALAVNQVTTFGDPGAAFNFNFSTATVSIAEISIDLLLLFNVQASTTFSIQYGIGANPSSFTTLGTWSDADVAGGWGSTTLTFDRTDFGSNLDNQSQAWFRVVALSPATGDGGSGARDKMAIDNFSITTSAVPEPSAMVLGLLGFLGLLGARRR